MITREVPSDTNSSIYLKKTRFMYKNLKKFLYFDELGTCYCLDIISLCFILDTQRDSNIQRRCNRYELRLLLCIQTIKNIIL